MMIGLAIGAAAGLAGTGALWSGEDAFAGPFWALVRMADGSKASTAAKSRQRWKRIFILIILGVPCLFGPPAEKNAPECKKSTVGSR
jgi:hypothetical protein